jgi:molybdopterin/thiamine biosynthesis adenylyltransferase
MKLLLENKGRVCQELEAINALAAEVGWLTVNNWGVKGVNDLCLNIDLHSHGEVYPVRLIYPELFPNIPATVEPHEGQVWATEHQYGSGGTLCLEFGPDNWLPSYTGADVLRSAYKLLHSITGPTEVREPVPSRHQLTIGQAFRSKHSRYILVDEVLSKLAEADNDSVFAISVGRNFREDAFVALIGIPKGEDDSTTRLIEKIKEAEQGTCRHWINGWAIADNELSTLITKATLQNLENHLRPRGLWPLTEEHSGKSSLFLLGNSTDKPRCFSIIQGDQPCAVELAQLEFFESELLRLPPELTELKTKQVAIIGLGSVGSKIAVSLARSGVENFLLVDDDILAPHNLVRNQLDWDDVGLHKVEAVATAIKKVHPGATVSVKCFRIGGQENSSLTSGVLNMIGQRDLIVDVTAHKSTFSLLSAVAFRNKKVLVWGELFAGGFGGLIARSRAGIEASPTFVRQHLNAYFETLPPAPFLQATDYNVIETGEVLIASDADVSLLAAHLTQFSLDSLRLPEQSVFPVSAYLVGFREGWVFKSPFDTIPIECPGVETEPVVESPAVDDAKLECVYNGVFRDLDALTKSTS